MKTFIAMESKLTTENRKSLPGDMFGLPKTRQFPINDEEHVRKAIQFFKHAPVGNRAELANNINKRIKELKMTVNISQESPFFKYMATDIVKEFFVPSLPTGDPYGGLDQIKLITDKIRDDYSVSLFAMFNRLFDQSSFQSLLVIEKELHEIFRDKEFKSTQFVYLLRNKLTDVNPFREINDVVRECYITILNFISYNAELDTTNSRLVYDIIDELCTLIYNYHDKDDKESSLKYLDTMKELITDYPCNFYHVFRKLVELDFSFTRFTNYGMTDDRTATQREIKAAVYEFRKYVETRLNDSQLLIDPYVASAFIDRITERDFKLASITMNLMSTKKELDSQIDIIKMDNASILSTGKADLNFNWNDTPGEVTPVEVTKVFSYLNGALEEDNIKRYKKTLTIQLDDQEVMRLSTISMGRIIVGSDNVGRAVYYGLDKDTLYLVTKDKNTFCFDLIIMVDNGNLIVDLENFICPPRHFDSSKAISIRNIRFNTDLIKPKLGNSESILTEGFFIDSSGNMKFKFQPKKTFMDEYSENHKVLMANYNANNVEAMKRNLAFLFALITEIDRDLHKGKFKEGEREKAIKAKAFSTNDFKTYMKHVLKEDPSFDFTNYYTESDYGKLIVSVGKDEIQGIKQVVRALLL